MSVTRTALRLVALLLLLASILLLRKPVFGQAITAPPTCFSVVIQGEAPSEGTSTIRKSINRVSDSHCISNYHRSNDEPHRFVESVHSHD